ncbi:conserved hypothetical protein [Acidithiobacillus caldus SM-1]|uniref:Uncharacterized protein n=2 Tax=Acidithiobacillus caldus TaxID=33059 RepID=F9ZPS1_ACICS|nr:conserved hypothetical protein [Acidithiobacillus caldus SM-1]AIA55527.1 hypothetical protein Acaty_c1667 [Acidithiobacillus caldus ATCC 51756]
MNRTTAALKEALLEAFDRGGGVDWLLALMKDEPKTFASLLSRLIPTETATKMEITNELTDEERRARIAAILDAGRARRDGYVASGGAGTDDDSLADHPS